MEDNSKKIDKGYVALQDVIAEGLQTLKKVDELIKKSEDGLPVLEDESAKEQIIREFGLHQNCLSDMVSVLREAAKEMASKCSIVSIVPEESFVAQNIEEDEIEGTDTEAKAKSDVQDDVTEESA